LIGSHKEKKKEKKKEGRELLLKKKRHDDCPVPCVLVSKSSFRQFSPEGKQGGEKKKRGVAVHVSAPEKKKKKKKGGGKDARLRGSTAKEVCRPCEKEEGKRGVCATKKKEKRRGRTGSILH